MMLGASSEGQENEMVRGELGKLKTKLLPETIELQGANRLGQETKAQLPPSAEIYEQAQGAYRKQRNPKLILCPQRQDRTVPAKGCIPAQAKNTMLQRGTCSDRCQMPGAVKSAEYSQEEGIITGTQGLQLCLIVCPP